MRDLAGDITQACDEWKKHAEGRLTDEYIKDVVNHVSERLSDMNPVLSLYGAYNAGKSTLLNAMLGQEIAAVGDSPETVKVDEYSWGDWTIYDTPGIDAPIEHEKTTEEHLRKSECLLFVVSTDGDLEARLIYEKIASLVQRQKPVLLVLNDKIGVLRDDNVERLTSIYERIDLNLSKIWQEQGLDKYDYPERIIINAKSALNARLSEAKGDPKPVLLGKSYLPELERKLESFLRARGNEDVVNGLVDFLEKPFSALEEIVTAELDNPNMQRVEKTRSKLEFAKQKLLVDAERFTRGRLSSLCAEIYQVGTGNRAELQQLIDESLAGLGDELQKLLAERLTSVSKDFSEEFIHPIIELVGDDIIEIPVSSDSSIIDEILSKGQQGISSISKDEFRNIAKTGIEKVATKIGGKLGGFLGKNAGKVAGPLVEVAFLAWGIFRAQREQEQYEQQIKAQAEALENMISRVRTDVMAETMRMVGNIAEDFFADCHAKLHAVDKQLALNYSGANDILHELRNTRAKMGELILIHG